MPSHNEHTMCIAIRKHRVWLTLTFAFMATEFSAISTKKRKSLSLQNATIQAGAGKWFGADSPEVSGKFSLLRSNAGGVFGQVLAGNGRQY